MTVRVFIQTQVIGTEDGMDHFLPFQRLLMPHTELVGVSVDVNTASYTETGKEAPPDDQVVGRSCRKPGDRTFGVEPQTPATGYGASPKV